MVLQPIRDGRRRLLVIAACYVSLIGIGWLHWLVVHTYVGSLAVIPLLFIAFYTRLGIALVTAFGTGVGLALLDLRLVPGGDIVQFSPAANGLALSATLCTVVIVAERLRVSSLQNVELRHSLQEARTQADRDALTGVANRRYFMRRLRACIRSLNGRQFAGVLFADLDGFKAVNDNAGHAAGDRVLALAAERLRHAIRAKDVLARIGGDEFAILIERLPDIAEAHSMAEKIENQFRDPFAVGDREFQLGVTVGVSIAPQDGLDPESLLRAADTRMYGAKEVKRSRETKT